MNTSKTDKAYVHFNNVEQYLRQRFDIRVRAEIVRELTGKLENVDIIDLGCGDGSVSIQFQSATNHITLVDISENMLEKANLNIKPEYSKNIKCIKSDVSSFVPPKKYDVVIGLGLLAHVNCIHGTLRAMSGLLKENGLCIIQLTDKTQLLSKILNFYNKILDKISGQFGYARNRLSVEEVTTLTARYGLKYVDSIQYSLTLPGMISLVPDKLMYQYHSYIRKSSLFSRFGSDFIMSFRK
ncbi:MAG: class I SAM-dependent methyltransferase [Bacteroidales bacterium]|nr:class I SAM-dependent methyltransferase [Bacteroidales bacterium]